MSARRTDLDGLRVLVCFLVILSHACVPFSREVHYHVRSAAVSAVPAAIYEVIHLSTMPLFFALAGWSAVTSLRRRGAARFLRERATRVLVPLAAGLVLLGPVIKYIELHNGREMSLSGFRTMPPEPVAFATVLRHYYPRLSSYTWSHLWFLAYLLVMSVALLPVLSVLARRAPRQEAPPAIAAWLPALPLMTVLVALGGYWPFLPDLIGDLPNLAFYATCLLLGAGLAAWPGWEWRLRAEAPYLLVAVLIGFAGEVQYGDSTAGRVFVGLAAWGAIGGAIGLAARRPPAAGAPFRYLSEAALPIYILHHVPVLFLAWAVVDLAWPVGWKVLAIFLPGVAITLAVYHFVVRPCAPLRWLVGMAPAVRSSVALGRMPERDRALQQPQGTEGA
jgi:peptidoglycan/LPS O-acetylase OafA/YrhL